MKIDWRPYSGQLNKCFWNRNIIINIWRETAIRCSMQTKAYTDIHISTHKNVECVEMCVWTRVRSKRVVCVRPCTGGEFHIRIHHRLGYYLASRQSHISMPCGVRTILWFSMWQTGTLTLWKQRLCGGTSQFHNFNARVSSVYWATQSSSLWT